MSLAKRSVAELVVALGERSPTPASGAATAVTGALAAALAELTARVSGEDEAVNEAVRLRERLLALADEDAAAYAAFMETRSEDARNRTIDVPLEIAELAAQTAKLGEGLTASARGTVAGDAEVAALLARAATTAAARLVELNLGGRDDVRVRRARELIA